jgi:uncharacterized protein
VARATVSISSHTTSDDAGPRPLTSGSVDAAADASAGATHPPAPARVALRWVELIGIFFVLPPIVAASAGRIPPIPILLALSVVALVCLLRDPSFDRLTFTRIAPIRSAIHSVALLWLAGAIMMSLIVHIARPDALLALPTHRPALWLMVMLLYPIFSVVPQTLIYRLFFVQRYAPILRNRWTMIIVGAAAFAIGHVIFRHWIPVVLTFVLGLIVLARYTRHRSAPLAVIEHAGHGMIAFTVGMGIYLFHGAERIARELDNLK